MGKREDRAYRNQPLHQTRAVWSYLAVLAAVLVGAEANAQQLIAPTFTSTPVTSVAEDTAYNYNITVLDPELPDTVTITAPTRPPWLTFTDNGNRTATLSGLPTQAQVGTHSVVLQASDGVNIALQSFTITVSNVNDAPTFTSAGPTAATEGALYSYTMTASDADSASLTFAAPTLPAWLSFNGTNTISGTPLQAHVGPHNVVVTVSDGTAPAVQQSFTITVANVNSAPTFTSTPATTGTEGAVYSYSMTASDGDGDSLNFAAPTLPAWLSFNGTNTISGTPLQAHVGPHNVVVTVSDGTAPAVQQSFTITVANVNNAPTFTSTPSTAATEGVVYSYTMTASDADGDSRTFAAPTLPAWLSFNGTNTISGTPLQAHVGPHNVVVTVSDGTAPAVQQSFTITVANVNDAPTFTSAGPTTASQGTPYSYTMTATDADGNPLTFAAPTRPAWLTFNGTNTLSGTPLQAHVGTHNVVVTVSDGIAPAVQQSFTITVTNVNDAPTFTNSGPTTANQGAPYSYTMTATDADGNPLTFAAPTLPAWLAFNGTNTISGTPLQAHVGAHNVVVTVSDGIAPAVQQSFTITVSNTADPPTLVTPIPDQAGTQGAAFGPLSVAGNFSDADGDALTFSATGFPAGSGLVLSAGGVISGMPTNAAALASPFGVTVTATATDGAVSDTFQFTVTNVNDPPTAVADAHTTAEDTTLNVAARGVLANDTDPDPGQTLTLTAVLDTNVTNGTLTLNANGSFAYVPNANYSGPDSFTYHANDGTASSNIVTVSITVTAVNDAPTTVADSYSTVEDTPLSVPARGVLLNDTDPDTPVPSLTAVVATSTSNGMLTLNANGSFSYSPNSNFSGTDSFTYRAHDGTVAGNVATVTITVSAVNDPPFVTSVPPTTVNEDVNYSYTVAATDPDGDSLTFLAPTLPAWLVFTPPRTIAGRPTQAEVGVHNVTLTISDGIAPAVQHSFQITVVAVDDAPVFDAIPNQTATELVPFSLSLATFVTDVDTPASSLVFAATSPLPAGLTLAANGVLSGIPLAAGIGDFVVRVTVRDATSPPQQASFNLTVLRAGRADLELSLSAAPNPVPLNTTATWTFTIKNNAPLVDVMGGVALQAVFGGDVPFQFATPIAGCTFTPSAGATNLACTLGPLAGGATTSVTLTGRGTIAGDVFATASVAIIGPVPVDETPRNDTASASLSVAQSVSTTPAQSIGDLDARAAAAGDLNGDGFVDLAIATGAAQSTSVLLNVVDPNNANKRALSTLPIALGGQGVGNGIALADLDGDADLDIVTAMGPGAANRIFLNSGSATFAAVTLGDPAEDSRAVAAGDINGDLLMDLVFANGSPSPVYIAQGSAGNFVRADQLGNADSRGVVLVDLFGSTLPELVFANADGDATVYGNTGGVFQLALTLPTGPTTSVATADFNNDQRSDLVFGRSTRTTPGAVPSNPVFLNTSGSTGSFFRSAELGAAPTAAVVAADINLDGAPDVLTINSSGGHQIYTNAAAASGVFALHPQQIARAGTVAAAVGKFGVDARIDAALVGPDGVGVFYNDGAGNLGSGDITGPTIQLRGESTVTLTVETPYTDAGATAIDTLDGDVSSRVVVTNPVNSAVVGAYTVTYNATDLSGNSAAPVTRTVRVQARQGEGGGGGGSVGLEFALLLAFAAVLRRLRPERNSWSAA